MLTREQKAKIIEEIISIFNSYKVLGFVDFYKLPTREYREMKRKLKDVNIKFFKKSLVIKALERIGREDLIPHLPDQVGILFTNRNPFEVYKEIKSLVTYRFAKENDTAEEDIILKPMVTNIPAGMAIAEFQKLKIEVGVEQGKIAIKKEKKLVSKGEKITKEIAGILQKLNIKPIPIRIKVNCLIEGKTIYTKDILDLDEKYYSEKISLAFLIADNLAEKLGIYTKYNLSRIIRKGYKIALEISIKAAIFSEKSLEEAIRRAITIKNIFKSYINIENMEYVYAALMLYEAKKEITEENLRKVLEAAGIVVDEAKIKSLVESLKNINIEEVIKSATSQPIQVAVAPQAKTEEKKEETKKEEEKKREEEAVAGLGALFGF
ncbi:MAG: 50S ribosomal protein P1 [Candidatus Aenigmatarchaeota archaeon]